MKKSKKPDEDEVLYWILILFCVFAAAFTAAIYMFELEDVMMTPCPFLQMTGLYCPGCGGTRAVRALLSGRIIESICMHPLVIYIAGFLLLFLGSHTLKHISGGRIAGLHYRNRYLIIGAVILAANCIIKNYYLIIKGIDLLGN